MPTPPPIVPVPAHVKLGYWAVAGGAVGHPVHIVFRDYPTWVVGELFARYTAYAGPKRTAYVTAEGDLRNLEQAFLEEDATPPRLVLLTDPRHADRVC